MDRVAGGTLAVDLAQQSTMQLLVLQESHSCGTFSLKTYWLYYKLDHPFMIHPPSTMPLNTCCFAECVWQL